jgi:hypothetical protein
MLRRRAAEPAASAGNLGPRLERAFWFNVWHKDDALAYNTSVKMVRRTK